ncbi:hypothetical protein [Brachybacterium sp. P6-10-X1]|nr:hypothetical protein [Brachybacterium sp. P6-10-X1]
MTLHATSALHPAPRTDPDGCGGVTTIAGGADISADGDPPPPHQEVTARP